MKLGRGTAIPHHRTFSTNPKKVAERAASQAALIEEERARQAVIDAGRPAAQAAEKAAHAAKVRANLTAWLADRDSKPAKMHAWLEEQCRMIGLLAGS